MPTYLNGRGPMVGLVVALPLSLAIWSFFGLVAAAVS
jgi:hypothetical protein